MVLYESWNLMMLAQYLEHQQGIRIDEQKNINNMVSLLQFSIGPKHLSKIYLKMFMMFNISWVYNYPEISLGRYRLLKSNLTKKFNLTILLCISYFTEINTTVSCIMFTRQVWLLKSIHMYHNQTLTSSKKIHKRINSHNFNHYNSVTCMNRS